MPTIRLAIIQMNSVMGALAQNAEFIVQAVQEAKRRSADLVIFPEMSLCGYPPEDLLLTQAFLQDTRETLESLAPRLLGTQTILGFAEQKDGKVYNAAAWIVDGSIKTIYRKVELPNYGVFDEKRYFTPGTEVECIDVAGCRIALSICEDTWVTHGTFETALRKTRPDLVINISASPFHADKLTLRKKSLADFSQRTQTTVVYCNMVGGQDELVFDGGAMVFTAAGGLQAESVRFSSGMLLSNLMFSPTGCDVTENEHVLFVENKGWLLESQPVTRVAGVAEVFEALLMGVRDYVNKNGFKHVVIGLSGGIDSALTAALAVEALGSDRVTGVTMPSQYSSVATLDDAKQVAERLGIRCLSIPIFPLFETYRHELETVFASNTQGVEFENLQARIRGNLLMALSNRYGWLVLTTGNKSETATGYCTLYGDMAGGFAVIKDVPKMLVYALSEFVNQRQGREVIPVSTIQRAPSAELRPNQKDEDSLPPYPVLDAIIQAYVEEDKTPDQIIAMGFAGETVMEVIRLIDRSEYKRRQAPPGIKITPKAFGRDRRLPLTNHYRPHPKRNY